MKDYFHDKNGSESLLALLAGIFFVILYMKIWRNYPLYFFLSLLIQTSCNTSKTDKTLTPAFYYWKTAFEIDTTENHVLKQTATKKLYVKFFDVDIENTQIQPKAALIWKEYPPQNIEIIPVVFITNHVFKELSAEKTDSLAKLIYSKINVIAKQKSVVYKEIQLDCDWSKSTQKQYFRFVKQIKSQFQGIVSCTIRFHQIKYADITGVPPADRGMLMCYNMADWKNSKTKNSIYDEATLNQYIDRVGEYFLPLDVAMPLFRWTVFYRNSRFMVFKNYLDAQTLRKLSFLAEKTKNNFIVQKDTMVWNVALRTGDLLRTEAVNEQELENGKIQLLKRIKEKKLTFAYYHLDSATLISYKNETLFH